MRYFHAVLLLVLPNTPFPLNLSGGLTAALRSWERQDTDSTSTARSTFHQLSSPQAKDLWIEGLSFHAYGSGFVQAERVWRPINPAREKRKQLW